VCGIVGIANRRGSVDVDSLNRARDVLTHRGPDDSGTWIDPIGGIGLAHRRLSIIDLSEDASQPMVNEDGSIVLIFNGEIYNFQALRDELLKLGHQFFSSSDTEVIIRAYEEWGMEAIAMLNGMFAFALYDRKSNRIVLARDRFGEKPLYYANTGSVFTFASELKALAALPGTQLRLDIDSLEPYLVFGNIPYPDTAFEGIHKLPPAHVLVFDIETWNGNVDCYWDMADANADTVVGADLEGDDALGRLDELITDSVRLRLIADVPVGAFLSGGVDSSLIVSIMSKLEVKVKTFSIGFKDEKYDEAPYAKAIAAYLGCEHYEHYVTPRESLDLLMELPSIYDEPFADSSAIPTYIVSRFAREQVKVSLSGDGGDELFGGYSTYPLFSLLGPLLQVPSPMRRLVAGALNLAGWGKLKRHASLLQIDEAWDLFLYLNERTIAKRFDVAKALKAPQTNALVRSIFYKKFQSALPRGNLQAAMYAEAHTYLVDDILTKVDRASMAVSLETRVPFLDHRVAEFATGLSLESKMGPWRLKKKTILRALLARYMPSQMFERPKHGFSVPLHTWFRGEMKWLLYEYLNKEKITREGLFNPEFVDGIVQEHLTGRRDREALLWSLVFWQMWREKWNV
jgi:asparagine synthase (glutamine-hydrolysing)